MGGFSLLADRRYMHGLSDALIGFHDEGRRGVKQVGAILFDLDGVLVDATEWHYEALNRALALFGFTISRYEHLSSYNGLPTLKKLEMLTIEKGLPKQLHSMISRLKQQY